MLKTYLYVTQKKKRPTARWCHNENFLLFYNLLNKKKILFTFVRPYVLVVVFLLFEVMI